MFKVGADIESICGKCGDVWHVVVALVGEKIAKVQCKQCGGQHRYRPPGGTKPAKTPRAKKAAKSKSGSAKATKKADLPTVEADLSRPVRPYLMSESFTRGDRLEHRVFGEGLVEEIVGVGKIQVFFTVGRKVLVHERSVES